MPKPVSTCIDSDSFKYNPFGRRIQKSFTQGSTTTTTNYLYDGDNSIEEVDQNGAVLARYLQRLNIDEPLAMLRGSTTSFYSADGLGSVTSLTNSSGTKAATYTYDSFGNLTASTGTLTNSFRYTAREFDTETNLYFYRARYYDPNSGRFLSEDPVRFDGGINFYAYVGNNASDLSDPLGLFTTKPGVPWPNLRLQALLDCIEFKTGLSLVVTSTTEPPPLSPHGPNDPHRRDGGLAVDIRYPSDPGAVLCAAANCGAQFARDEKVNPSSNSTGDHIHLQLVPGPPKKPRGDLPQPMCP
jgi:RHS repeat-associated protein